jgi:hypothetical protein
MREVNVILSERKGAGAIRLCDCNCIHLNIGPVTITLTPEMFTETAVLVKQAMEQLSVIAAAGELEQAQNSRPN